MSRIRPRPEARRLRAPTSAGRPAPLVSPSDRVELSFTATANTSYRVWVRLNATNNSKWNDSVWLQFSDAVSAGGSALYRTGTTSALLLNLEQCSGCGASGWGWVDGAYWLAQSNIVQFASTGPHTLRVQSREDGAQVDQIVFSPATYLSRPPGSTSNDATILPRPGSGTGASSLAYLGAPVTLPGTLQAPNFDTAGEGLSFHDTSSGNSGGAYRSTDVDIEPSADGGYDVGWLAAGEWMNYSVTVATSGQYTVQMRVASPGALEVEQFDAGGEAVAYHDTTSGNAGGALRSSSDVDIENTSGGGQNVGWVAAGEWLAYSVNVSSAGTYSAQFRVASLGRGGSFHLEMNGTNVSGALTVPDTGGWQSWQTPTASVQLSAGPQVARLVIDSTGLNAAGNFDRIQFTNGSTPQPAVPRTGRHLAIRRHPRTRRRLVGPDLALDDRPRPDRGPRLRPRSPRAGAEAKQPSWRGQGYAVKNLIEFKNAQRVTIDGNVLEYNWSGGQSGHAIVLTPRNQDGGAPWSIVQGITITNNVIRHVSGVLNVLGTDYRFPSQPLSDVVFRNNLVVDLSAANWGGAGQLLLTSGRRNLTLDHNTVFTDGTSVVYADGAPVYGFTFTNNIVPDNSWAVMGAGSSEGTGTLNTFFPNVTFLRNVIVAGPT